MRLRFDGDVLLQQWCLPPHCSLLKPCKKNLAVLLSKTLLLRKTLVQVKMHTDLFSAFSAVHTFKMCVPLLGHQKAESRELTSNKMDGSKVVSVRCIPPRFPLHSQPFQLAHPLLHRPPSFSYSSRLAIPLHPNLIKGDTWRIILSYLDLTFIHSPPSLLPLGRSFARETRIPHGSREPKISL